MLKENKLYLANKYLRMGYRYHIKGDVEKAIEEYKLSLEYFPTAKANTYLGKIYENKGEWMTALQYYNESLDINPDYKAAQDAVIRITSLLN
jgi:tetratricopeptide (TPR) repeat protein